MVSDRARKPDPTAQDAMPTVVGTVRQGPTSRDGRVRRRRPLMTG